MMRSLLEHTPDAIYFKDREHRFVRVSRTMAEDLGLDPVGSRRQDRLR